MSVARWTDGELVERLKLLAKHGTVSKAASKYGIGRSAFSESVTEAKRRGLTAATRVVDMEDKLRSKVKVLEAELASVKRERDTAEAIRTEIYKLAALTPDAPHWISKVPHKGVPGVPMVMWSDWHYGETVRASEIGGANTFNREVAKARIKRLVQSVIDLALHHMVNPRYPGIVVCLGGDMISGAIHDELRDTNDGYTTQALLEVQEQLIAALTLIADKFGRVFVPCVVGNHGRTTLKPRAKGRVFESYEWHLYCQLELHFRNDRRIHFMIPGETDAYFSVLGHRFLLTHGDALGVKGGDGIIGALGPITRGAIKVSRSERQLGRDVDTIIMGHWHTYIPRGEATPVICNGALKGYDEYARLFLRVPPSRPSQAMWFVHPKHGITAQWQVYLDEVKRHSAADWVAWGKSGKSHGNHRTIEAA